MLTLYYISFLILIIALVLGIKNYERLENLKIIFFILVFSLIQIVFSEILYLIIDRINPNSLANRIEKGFSITNIYTVIEFGLILSFFESINKNQKTRKVYIISFFIGIAAYVTPFLINEYKSFIFFKYFSFVSGFIILAQSLFQINRLLKIFNSKNQTDTANLMMCIGIFLSNIILWPTTIIQSSVVNNFEKYYTLFVIANSIGYIILYLFSSITFYGKNKY